MEPGKTEIIQKKVLKDFDSISNTYAREDLEEALDDFLKARPDNTIFLEGKLNQICEKLSIDKDRLLKDRSLLEQVPDRKNAVEDKLTSMIYQLHLMTPSPADNMARIVRRLASEYKEDSVRMAILKKFILGTELNCSTIYTKDISRWAYQKMNAVRRKEYEKGSDREKAESVIQHLDESIFDDLKDTGKLTASDKLDVVVDQMVKLESKYGFFDKDNVPVKLFSVSFDAKKIRPILKEAGILYRKKDSCLTVMKKLQKLGILLSSSVAEEVIKQFRQTISGVYYLQRKGEAGKPAQAWVLFDNALKDAEKKNRNGELIELCNDFANGVFRTDNGEIRKRLFQFAIVFDMTVQPKDEEKRDDNTDIEKNLFEDYYCDNMMRFLSEDFTNREISSIYENEPTGEGINYKNYVEIVYVYYLYRKDLKLTAGERIDKAEKMINKCRSYAENVRKCTQALVITEDHKELKGTEDWEKAETVLEEYQSGTKQKYVEIAKHKKGKDEFDDEPTSYFKALYTNVIGEIPEKYLARYICRNFRVLPSLWNTADSTPKIQIAAGERKAFSKLNEILDSIYEQYASNPDLNNQRDNDENANADDEDDLYKWENIPLINSFVSDLGIILREKYSKNSGFLRIVDQIEKRLRFEFEISGTARSRVLARILAIFCFNPGRRFKNQEIKESIDKVLQVNGLNINRCIRILKSAGYKIESKADEKGKRPVYWMDQNIYTDEVLQHPLDVIASYGGAHEQTVQAIDNLLLIKNPKECRVTRSRLVAAAAIQFVTQDDFYDDSIPVLYDSFKGRLNKSLEGTRYQAYNEKNIFDLYIFVSVYICLMHNDVI